MNDQRLEVELRAALLRDDPGPAGAELRSRVSAIPEQTSPIRGRLGAATNGAGSRGPAHSPRVSRWIASLEAVAAVVLVAAIIGIALGLRWSGTGPASSSRASATAPVVAPSASASPSIGSPNRSGAVPSSASSPTPPSAPSSAVATGEWRGLSWSATAVIPDSQYGINDIVAWNGGFVAVGFVPVPYGSVGSASEQVAFWSSPDGTTWTHMSIDETPFTAGAVSGLVVSDVQLVAWGTLGQPTCTGEGEGMTCDPTPAMLWTSTDGAKWTRVADVSMFGGGTIANVTFGADGFVAVGDSGWDSPAIWYSNFGTTWQRLSLPTSTFAAAHFSSVSATTYGDATTSGYVLGGSIGGTAPVSGGVAAPNTGVAAAWWSPDGRSWTKAAVNRNAGAGTSLGSIDVGASGMVAVGSAEGGKAAAAWTSTDGRTWQPIALGYFGAPTPAAGVPTLPGLIVRSDGRHLVTIDEDQSSILMWISSDGVNWRRLAFSGSTDTIPSTYGNAYVVPDGLIVLGQQGSSPAVPVWRLTATG
jgi:hypothetical protein